MQQSSPMEFLDTIRNSYVVKDLSMIENNFRSKRTKLWAKTVREFYQWARNSAVRPSACPRIQPSIRLASGGGELPGGSGGCAMQEMLGLHCRTLIAAFYDGATEKCISNTSAGAALPAPRRRLAIDAPSLSLSLQRATPSGDPPS